MSIAVIFPMADRRFAPTASLGGEPGSPDRPRACRALFGRRSSEESLNFVRRELASISQRDRTRWNFDFDSEVPEEGRFEWQPVRNTPPEVYSLSRLPFCGRSISQDEATSAGDNAIAKVTTLVSAGSSSTSTTDDNKRLTTTNVENIDNQEALRQTCIQDFMRITRKRSLSSSSQSNKASTSTVSPSPVQVGLTDTSSPEAPKCKLRRTVSS